MRAGPGPEKDAGMKKIKAMVAAFSVAVVMLPVSAQAEAAHYGYCQAKISKDDKRKVIFSTVQSTSLNGSYSIRLESGFRNHVKSQYRGFIDGVNCFVAINGNQEAIEHRNETMARAKELDSAADVEGSNWTYYGD